jgi:hypothetical protein
MQDQAVLAGFLLMLGLVIGVWVWPEIWHRRYFGWANCQERENFGFYFPLDDVPFVEIDFGLGLMGDSAV